MVLAGWNEKSERCEVKKFGTDRRMAEFVHVFLEEWS